MTAPILTATLWFAVWVATGLMAFAAAVLVAGWWIDRIRTRIIEHGRIADENRGER